MSPARTERELWRVELRVSANAVRDVLPSVGKFEIQDYVGDSKWVQRGPKNLDDNWNV
jgi:hypothetical protein